MGKEEILEKVKNLDAKVVEVINALTDSQNRSFKPDMYGFVLFWCQFGEVLSLLREHYDSVGWPISFLGTAFNHRSLLVIDDVTRCCHRNLNKLEVLSEFEMSGFYDNAKAKDLLDEVILRSSIGDYIVPSDESLASLKKEVICRTLDIFYRLLQDNADKCDYDFKIPDVIDETMNNYQVYKEQIGREISYLSPNEKRDLEIVYEGPQFGKEIETCFSALRKNNVLEEKVVDSEAKLKVKKYTN